MQQWQAPWWMRGGGAIAANAQTIWPALASRYIKQVHILPYYLGDGQEWLTATRALLEKERFALVLPCEERSLLPLIRHQPI